MGNVRNLVTVAVDYANRVTVCGGRVTLYKPGTGKGDVRNLCAGNGSVRNRVTAAVRHRTE